MKAIVLTIAAIVVILSTGCASTSMKHQSGDFLVEWESRTMFKDVKDANVMWGDFAAEIGSSTSRAEQLAALCILLPQSPICTGEQ